ncbi:butyrate kinase [Dermatophilus congolensis]|uniref:butyrate kinase n=1 Tax=Dermatophilus congolensis TaxID=1863 RepID=UPI001AAFB1F5|nr:butyrate kinase [Dermatophilus congolensis]MBO3142418.1 butyrate kinase [Dermatophilus congolensis]MBO3151409.1 butyrate kinase [Dermatophilus congolensis]MBO3162694.1 butyrate kinase [Dermatophilus congolensis]MBO3176247.1 butyrate kinase [Dermatophilus congolensis]MBO3202143.1 butyrate kinase [Dermatophilus congolensis]
MKHILAINPGATSTKIAVYNDTTELFREEITYDPHHFAHTTHVIDQLDTRANDIEKILRDRGENNFDAVVGRGGLIGPVAPGAITVDDTFEDIVRNRPTLQHASNLGGPLARIMAATFGIPHAPAYVYDPVTVDEISDVARITGIAGIHRESIGHHLNMRAVAIDLANKLGKGYPNSDIIVVHIGGGSSASAHQHGTVIDFISDDEIQFSAERSGGLPLKTVTTLLNTMSVEEFTQLVRSRAGLRSHADTTDLRVLENRIDNGDTHAALILEAMALNIAKAIGCLATTMKGSVDAIILTGGMAHSNRLCTLVAERTAFIAPLHPYPGEAEMAALAAGALRVLNGEEHAHTLTP